LTGDLAEHVVTATGIGQAESGADFRLSQIGEGERDDYDFAGCRCAQAASSSARFQSVASERSLRTAVSLGSAEDGSSKIITSARRGDVVCIGRNNRTLPSGSKIPSIVWTMPVSPLRDE
jgi:hypothetical protein